MKTVPISGWNNRLLPPRGWDHDKLPCDPLYLRATRDTNKVPYLTSAWMPTKEELEQLNKGCPILLSVITTEPLPPMMVHVGTISDLQNVLQPDPRLAALLSAETILKPNGKTGDDKS